MSGENELYGASTPFQFTVTETKRTPSHFEFMMKSSMMESRSSKSSEKSDPKFEKELDELREENSVLKSAIKALTVAQNNDTAATNYDKDIAELREITDSLKIGLTQQQQEINVLKMKIKECGEEYKKLYLEKMKLEKKLHSKEKAEKTVKELVVRKVVNGEDFDITSLPSMPPFPMHK